MHHNVQGSDVVKKVLMVESCLFGGLGGYEDVSYTCRTVLFIYPAATVCSVTPQRHCVPKLKNLTFFAFGPFPANSTEQARRSGLCIDFVCNPVCCVGLVGIQILRPELG